MNPSIRNPYKKGTFEFSIWQAAYLAGRIDGAFFITMAHMKKIEDESKERSNG